MSLNPPHSRVTRKKPRVKKPAATGQRLIKVALDPMYRDSTGAHVLKMRVFSIGNHR